jgi:hypothetical protein
MFKQKPFPFSLVVLVAIILFHTIASYRSWYWLYPWSDVIIHLLCGLWIGLILLWLASVFNQINSLRDYRVKSFLITLFSTVLFGVIWEILEVYGQITFTYLSAYGLDTAGDILSGAVGGILAYLYFCQRNRVRIKSVEVMHPFYNQTGLIKS